MPMTDIRQNYVQFNRVCFSAGGVLRGNQCVCSQIEKFGKQERVPYGPSTYMFTWKNVFILFGLFKWKTETAALIKIFVTCKSICEGAIMELLPENITQNKAILCSIFSHVFIFSSKTFFKTRKYKKNYGGVNERPIMPEMNYPINTIILTSHTTN